MLRYPIKVLSVLCLYYILVAIQFISTAYGQTYECRRAASPIAIDGKFDEAAWRVANWTNLRENSEDKQIVTPGKFAIIYDTENLYIGYDLKDKNILSGIYIRDDRLWVQDVAEIFLSPMGYQHVYYEFQFNAVENIRDIVILHSGKGDEINPLADYNSATQLKVTVNGTLENNQDTDEGWLAEVAIPFKDLWIASNNPPRTGDQWKFNVYRIDYGLEEPEMQAWNPAFGPYHSPWKFGTLIFKD
jgi:hypothetical protein